MDRIHIRDLHLRCIIGAYPQERAEKQDVVINLTLKTDLSEAARTDRLDRALDYKALKKRVIAFVERSRFHLLEALAEAIAELCLEDPRVIEVSVCVDKPGALRFARSVAVEITRRRAPPDSSPKQ